MPGPDLSHEEYSVVSDEGPCETCGQGQTWAVIDGEGVLGATSYEDECRATEQAVALNAAFARGFAAGRLVASPNLRPATAAEEAEAADLQEKLAEALKRDEPLCEELAPRPELEAS